MNRALAPFRDCSLRFPTKIWRARAVAVADGDTITVLIDRGGATFTAELWDIRFASIDAYESSGAFTADHIALGKAAKAFVIGRALSRWCYLLTQMDPEKYGRILGDPFPLQPDGVLMDLCWELYSAGLVKPGAYRGPVGGPRDIRRYLPEFGGGA